MAAGQIHGGVTHQKRCKDPPHFGFRKREFLHDAGSRNRHDSPIEVTHETKSNHQRHDAGLHPSRSGRWCHGYQLRRNARQI